MPLILPGLQGQALQSLPQLAFHTHLHTSTQGDAISGVTAHDKSAPTIYQSLWVLQASRGAPLQ